MKLLFSLQTVLFAPIQILTSLSDEIVGNITCIIDIYSETTGNF